MTYLLLICVAENGPAQHRGKSAAMGPATESWVAEMDGRGVRSGGSAAPAGPRGRHGAGA